MLEYCALASGSRGNCFYIGNETEAVLIDAGISRKQTLSRLDEMNLSSAKIKAIFITHEHVDHCQGMRLLQRIWDVPVYLTKGTYNGLSEKNLLDSPSIISDNEEVWIGSILVKAFAKKHDGIEPCSFYVESEGSTVGVFTDIGKICSEVIRNFSRCDALFLESNYDADALENSPYPMSVINRIRSDKGHLSNVQAKELVEYHRNEKLQHVVLAHLSANNNSIDAVEGTFIELREEIRIDISTQEKPTSVFIISSEVLSGNWI